MQRDDSVYVGHMLDMSRKASEKVAAVSRLDYDKDENLRLALAHFEADRRIRVPLGTAASDTLVTKIMLGVFGCVPAFDTYFKKGLGAWRFGPKALRTLGEFCRENADLIERGRVRTLEFESGQETGRRYTRAKVIDMIFFTAGERMLGSAGREAGGQGAMEASSRRQQSQSLTGVEGPSRCLTAGGSIPGRRHRLALGPRRFEPSRLGSLQLG